jgi:DNA modification methylase
MSVRILQGDVRDVLAGLAADTFDCVVTSPPYWGLRDYGVEGQLGLEPTLAEHLSAMIDVFRAVRHVLKPEGTLWLNYGDCYATKPNGRSAADTKAAGTDDRTFRDKPFSTIGGVLKPKDLCMVPNRLAIALQEDGWWVRSEIIWAKPNPMPDSSGRYRPSTAHEKIFMLTKSGKSFYDSDAVRMPASQASMQRRAQDVEGQEGSHRANAGGKTNGTMKAVGGPRADKQRGHSRRHQGFSDRWDAMTKAEQCGGDRLLRNYERAPVNVWEIATQPFSEAHFATFPPELAERCIKAGCPMGGHVLDPFGGAGTTGLVADRLGRHATLIELNPEYIAIARRRIEGDAPLFAEVDHGFPHSSTVA